MRGEAGDGSTWWPASSEPAAAQPPDDGLASRYYELTANGRAVTLDEFSRLQVAAEATNRWWKLLAAGGGLLFTMVVVTTITGEVSSAAWPLVMAAFRTALLLLAPVPSWVSPVLPIVVHLPDPHIGTDALNITAWSPFRGGHELVDHRVDGRCG